MKTIKIKPNTFYVRKDITDDIGVMPVFPDSYVGLTDTYDIKSNPDTSIFLAESATVSPSDFVYGEGKISDIYLDLYVNSITQENAQTGAWLDVFMLKPNLDIVEGNMTIVSGAYSAPILYYNSYNDSTSWVVEDFDGTPKDFINHSVFTKTETKIQTRMMMTIKRHQLMDIVFEGSTKIDSDKDDHSGWTLSNLWEEITQGVEWSGYQLTKVAHGIVQYLGAIGDAKFETENRNVEYQLRKGTDGLYGLGRMSAGAMETTGGGGHMGGAGTTTTTHEYGSEGGTYAAADLTLTVTDATGFLEGSFIRIDNELLAITAVAGNDLTVERGRYGTSAVDHTDGAAITQLTDSGDYYLNFFTEGESISGGASSATTDLNFTQGTTSIENRDKFIIASDLIGNPYQFPLTDDPVSAFDNERTYRYDQSDSSNTGHPFRLSEEFDGTQGLTGVEYTTGVTTNGTPGSSGAYTQITVASGAPTLYYYCTNHSGMGGTANTP